MGKNKKQKKWHESDDFIPAPKEEKSVDLTGFLIQGTDGPVEALDPANKAAVVLAQVINDPKVKNVVTLGPLGIPEGLEVYDPKTHRLIKNGREVYDPQINRVIPKHLGTFDPEHHKAVLKHKGTYEPTQKKVVDKELETYNPETHRPIPKNFEAYDPATLKAVAKHLETYNPDVQKVVETELYDADAKRYLTAVDRLKKAAERHMFATVQDFARAVLADLGEGDLSDEEFGSKAEQAWAEYNAARAAEGKTPSKTEPLIYDPTPLERPDMMIHQVNGEFAVWANGLQVPEGAFYPGGWVVGKFDEHGNWERHSTMPADSNATQDFVPLRPVSRFAQVTPVPTVEQEASANAEKRRTRLREVKPDPEPEVDPLERYQDALTEGLELLSKIAASTEQIAKAHKPTIADIAYPDPLQ